MLRYPPYQQCRRCHFIFLFLRCQYATSELLGDTLMKLLPLISVNHGEKAAQSCQFAAVDVN